MADEDKVTIARVEQQLKDAVTNQTQIIEDLRTIFARIERESKVIAVIRADVKSHLDTSVSQKDELNFRFKTIEERHAELKETYNRFKDKIEEEVKLKEGKNPNIELLRKDLFDLGEKINKLKLDNTAFETEIRTSLKNTKLVFTIICSLGTLIVALIKIYDTIIAHAVNAIQK